MIGESDEWRCLQAGVSVLLVIFKDVANLRKSVATARESVLDVSSLKAKSERKRIEESGLLGCHKCGSQIRGKPGLRY
jgi:hypothetical protein